MNIAKVAISNISYHIDKPYSYKIPVELSGKVEVGMRVNVPFGRSNKPREGIVLSLGFEESSDKLKQIYTVLDTKPVLNSEMIQLILWMRKRIFCTCFDGVRAALPTGLWFQKVAEYELFDIEALRQKSVFDDEFSKLLENFQKKQKLTDTNFKKIFGNNFQIIIDNLLSQNIIQKKIRTINRANDKSIKIFSLDMPYNEAYERALKGRNSSRIEVVSTLSNMGSLSLKELMYMTGATESVINTMVKNGILKEGKERVYRGLSDGEHEITTKNELLENQKIVYDGIEELLNEQGAHYALLHGITGSGKTHIYIKLIEKVLKDEKTAIMLVPEIALTPQMIAKFRNVFSDTVAVLHSALSPGEKYDQWQRIKEGQAKVVIGTRSAIFAPLSNIGIIIVDEEQDGAYKSESAPKYDARDIAKYRVYQNNALLLLGSATPSVDNYYFAKHDKMKLFTLSERYGKGKLPEVYISDMRGAIKQGYGQNFSETLVDEMQKNIENSEQTILFLNRRGNSRHVKCITCGFTPLCKHCSVSLTYHSANDRIMCHYCGYSEKMPLICPECSSRHLENAIAGTQKIEEDIKKIFGDVDIIRMDADTTSTKNSHEKLLKKFSETKSGILLGTQMVTKGLDFKDVTLVGVLNADLSLYSSDYKSREKTFSLITQVVGRAGRHDKNGRAIIQTFSPDHPVILSGAKQDYVSFYESEIELRHALLYPPFEDITVFTLTSEREHAAISAAIQLKKRLTSLSQTSFKELNMVVLGPSPAIISKIFNKYRYHVTIRSENLQKRRELISGILAEFQNDKKNNGVVMSVDINPDTI